MEYVLYCDESSDKGPKYSDFFGGCIVSLEDLAPISAALEAKKAELNLKHEVKWSRVTKNYLDKYIALVDLFFHYVRSGRIRVRIMFRKTQNQYRRTELTHDDKYFKLYYQFIKHGFGLKSIPSGAGDVYVRIYLDQLPDSKERCAQFKRYLYTMPCTQDFHGSPLKIRESDIAEVLSHEHVLLQCTDIVLGAMFFRLNNLHEAKPEGSTRRGNRTIAKEKLYNHIRQQICTIHPNFNIGVSTASRGYVNPHWNSPYEHWEFTPYEQQ